VVQLIEICPAKPSESLMLKFVSKKKTFIAVLLNSGLNASDSRNETVSDLLAVTGDAERSAGGDG
jgi:hypothetical protein